MQIPLATGPSSVIELLCFEACVLSLATWEVGGYDINVDWLAGDGASSREHQDSRASASITRDGQTALEPEERTR